MRRGRSGHAAGRVSPTDPLSITPLRSLFARDDAWVVTGDLFRRDADGDYWRLDGLADAIRTAQGPVFTTPIRDALGEIAAVDLAAAYGVRPEGAEWEIALAAVSPRVERSLTARELGEALSTIPRERRPAVILVVDRIPVTTWFRPLTQALREAGVPEPGEGVRAW